MMTTLIGANWRTTLSGWIAVLASAIAVNPTLIAFLPERFREPITGIAGLIAVLSGGTFAYTAKDKQVTGGTTPNDKASAGVSSVGSRIYVLIAGASIFVTSLSGCAWIRSHQRQWDSTLHVIESRVLDVATRVLIAAASNDSDKDFKADFLDSVAAGLREGGATVVSSEDVEKIVKIWSPNDGAQWKALAGELGSVAADAFGNAGEKRVAAVVEHIATGLNNAAAAARPTAR